MLNKYFLTFCYVSLLFRTVKLCQDFIGEVRDEKTLQATYQVVAKGRKLAPSDRYGKRSKSVLKHLNRF